MDDDEQAERLADVILRREREDVRRRRAAVDAERERLRAELAALDGPAPGS